MSVNNETRFQFIPVACDACGAQACWRRVDDPETTTPVICWSCVNDYNTVLQLLGHTRIGDLWTTMPVIERDIANSRAEQSYKLRATLDAILTLLD